MGPSCGVVLGKELLITTLGFLCETVAACADEVPDRVLIDPLKRLSAILEARSSVELFRDWYPPPRTTSECMPLKGQEISASSVSDESRYLPADALFWGGEERRDVYEDVPVVKHLYWLSKKGARVTTWTACVESMKNRDVCAVEMEFWGIHAPKQVVLLVSKTSDGATKDSEERISKRDWIEIARKDVAIIKGKKNEPTTYVCGPFHIPPSKRIENLSYVHIKLIDFAQGNDSQQHSLKGVRIRCAHRAYKVMLPVRKSLATIQSLADSALLRSHTESVQRSGRTQLRNVAIRTMANLTRVSGSLDHALALLKIALDDRVRSTQQFDQDTSSAVRELVRALLAQLDADATNLAAQIDSNCFGDGVCIVRDKSSSDGKKKDVSLSVLNFCDGVKLSLESAGGQLLATSASGPALLAGRKLNADAMFTLREYDGGWGFETAHGSFLCVEDNSKETADGETKESRRRDAETKWSSSNPVSSRVVALPASQVSEERRTWTVVMDGKHVLLRGSNGRFLVLSASGGLAKCDAAQRAQALKLRIIQRSAASESYKVYCLPSVPLKRPGSIFLGTLEHSVLSVDGKLGLGGLLGGTGDNAEKSITVQGSKIAQSIVMCPPTDAAAGGGGVSLKAHAVWINPQLCAIQVHRLSSSSVGTDVECSSSESSKGDHLLGKPGARLASPYSISVSGDSLRAMHGLAESLLQMSSAKGGDRKITSLTTRMTVGILQIVEANLSWLLVSKVDPEAVGIRVYGNSSEERTLQPMLRLLERLIELSPTKPSSDGSDKRSRDEVENIPAITQHATNVWDAGLELFFPTSEARRDLAKNATVNGVTLEFQLQFPTQISCADDLAMDAQSGHSDAEFDCGDGTDVRFERFLLMLRLECSKNGWKHELIGRYHFFLHLVISVPKDAAATFLSSTLDRICRQAGFADGWQFPMGIRRPFVRMKIERYLHFDRQERLGSEFSVGCVRLYSTSVGSYEDVCAQVTRFVG
eukprot:g2793.t1